MNDNHDDRKTEDLLARYRPAPPPAELRARVLKSAPSIRQPPWLPLAAGLAIAGLLQWAAAQVDARTAQQQRTDPALRTATEGIPALDALPPAYVQSRLSPPRRSVFGAPDADEIL